MLPNSVIDLPFGIGVDESVEKDILEPNGAVSVATNVKIDKRGSYQKRDGLSNYATSIVNGGFVASGHSVHEFDQSFPLITDGRSLYDWSSDQSQWIERGKVSECVVERGPGIQSPNRSFIYRFDSLVVSGCRFWLFSVPRGASAGDDNDLDNSEYSDVYFEIQDETTGAVIQGPKFLAQVRGQGFPDSLTLASTATGYVCVTAHTSIRNGSNAVTSNSLVRWTWNMNTPSATFVQQTMYTNNTAGSGPAVYMRAAQNDLEIGNPAVIYYLYHTPGPNGSPEAGVIYFDRFNPATQTSTTVQPGTVLNNSMTGVGASQIPHLAYDQVGDRVWVFWRDSVNANFYVRVFNGTTLAPTTTANQTLNPTQIPNNVVNSITSTFGPAQANGTREIWITYTIAHNGDPNASIQFRKAVLNSGQTSVVASDFGVYRRLGIQAYAEPINYQGRWYQWVCQSTYNTVSTYGDGAAYQNSSTRTLFLVEVDGLTGQGDGYLRPVANIAPRLIASTNMPCYPHLVTRDQSPQSLEDGYFSLPIPVQRNNTSGPHLELLRASFVDNRRQQSAPFGDVITFSGACPTEYDGDSVHEVNFLHPPQIDVIDSNYTVGNQGIEIVAGTYSCFAIWEHTDARGNVHQSGPSNIITKTFANSRTVSCRAHPIVVTGRARVDYSTVRLVIYRTRTNELTFYRDNEQASSQTFNVITQVYWTQDKNMLFYTQPGVAGANQFHLPPPSLRCLVNHNGALAGVAEDGRTIWFSGPHLPGEGAYFYNAFIVYVDDPGKITALATMDGRLYAFTETSIWVVDGPGFADNGEGGFAPAQRLTTDTGCISERSVVVSPAGILYQTQLGISLLTRSLEVVPFGRTVEETLELFPVITSAVLAPTLGEVRFTCTKRFDEGGSRILVWDYRNEAWLIHEPGLSVGGTSLDISHAAMVTRNGIPNYHVLYRRGQLSYTLPTPLDAGFTFPAVIETSWIKVAGLQGFQRCRRVQFMGQQLNDGTAGVRIEVMYDYNISVVQTQEWNSAELSIGLEKNIMELHLARQKCTAIKIRITTLPYDDGFTQSPSEACNLIFRGLRLLVAIKGKNPLRPANRG